MISPYLASYPSCTSLLPFQSVLPRGPDEQVADCVAQSLWVEIEDSPTANLLSEYPQTSEFVREALASGGRVLVRCAQGVSRSVAVRPVSARSVTCREDAIGSHGPRRACSMQINAISNGRIPPFLHLRWLLPTSFGAGPIWTPRRRWNLFKSAFPEPSPMKARAAATFAEPALAWVQGGPSVHPFRRCSLAAPVARPILKKHPS